MTKPVLLYTVGVVADELGVDRRAFRYWAEKENPDWFYVEPYAVAPGTADSKRLYTKLWHSDQFEELGQAWVKYQAYRLEESIAAATRRKLYLKEYNKRYWEDKKKKEAEKPTRIQTVVLSPMKPKPKPKPVKKELPFTPPNNEAQEFYEEFEKEREEKAMQILMGIK
jgi:hypothetical protein